MRVVGPYLFGAATWAVEVTALIRTLPMRPKLHRGPSLPPLARLPGKSLTKMLEFATEVVELFGHLFDSWWF